MASEPLNSSRDLPQTRQRIVRHPDENLRIKICGGKKTKSWSRPSRDVHNEGPNASRGRRLPRCSARPVAHVTAAARPAGVARLLSRCRSRTSSWLRDLRHAPNAGWNSSWHQSYGIQAAISKARAPTRREDGVRLTATHTLSRKAHGRRLTLALAVGISGADGVRVLGAVT